jgi:hypothetical protein
MNQTIVKIAVTESGLRFNTIPIKIPMTEIEKYPKIHMEEKKTSNSQSNPKQKEQCWRYHLT